MLGQHNIPKINPELVAIKAISADDEIELKALILTHIRHTDSKKAKEVLNRFDRKEFFKIIPHDYQKALDALKSFENEEDSELKAFLKITQEH